MLAADGIARIFFGVDVFLRLVVVYNFHKLECFLQIYIPET